MAGSAKEKLVDFLEEKAFRPILNADPEDFPESKRDKLKDVQRATESERDRFRGYDSAEEVYEMFRDDLTSDEADEVNRELRDLGLLTLHDVRGDFERLADEVGASR